jgi:hypothetical protein
MANFHGKFPLTIPAYLLNFIEHEKEYQVRWRSGPRGKAGNWKAESRNALRPCMETSCTYEAPATRLLGPIRKFLSMNNLQRKLSVADSG